MSRRRVSTAPRRCRRAPASLPFLRRARLVARAAPLRSIDSRRTPRAFPQAMSSIETTVDERAEAERQRELELAAVEVNKEDVDLIVKELEVSKDVADRELRIHKGCVKAALRALVNA